MEMNNKLILISEKYALTIQEACEYFSIGEKRIRNLINQNPNSNFVLMNGSKYLIKRKKLEQYLDEAHSI